MRRTKQPPAWLNQPASDQQLETSRSPHRSSEWPLRILGLLLVVGGMALSVVSAMQFIQYRTHGDWPTITATLTSTRIAKRLDSEKVKTY